MIINKRACLIATGISAVSALSTPTFAQDNKNFTLEEVIVTARRKNESLQDTPLTVNAVNNEKLQDLNITNFADLNSAIAGVSFNEDVIASGVSMRGIKFEVLAQASASVEFYMNESPATALQVMQKIFDVSQVEVLRGPQGTLRGKASPSGSITVRTRQADLEEFGGYFDTSLTDDGDKNFQGAVNLPIIEDRLGVRIAGFWDENNLNDVSSAYGLGSSNYKGNGYRLTVTAQPMDNLSINATYEQLTPDRELFTPVVGPGIFASDRRSVEDVKESSSQDLQTTTLNIEWDISDTTALYYTGGYHSVYLERTTPDDPTNAIDSSYSDVYQGASAYLLNDADTTTHELRVQSTVPLFDKIDYVLGSSYISGDSTVITNQVSYLDDLFFGYAFLPPPLNFLSNAGTQLNRNTINNFGNGNDSDTQEVSFFANLTYHFSSDTELSLGARKIQYNNNSYLQIVNSLELQNLDENEDHEIYTAAFSHRFNEDILVYSNWGTSWRAGPNLVGVLANPFSSTLTNYSSLPSETSESIEVGLKSTWLDQRLRINAAAYHQQFENLAYRPSEAIFYDGGAYGLLSYNLQSAVPVDVNGIELEIGYGVSENLSVSALINYAKGEIDNGTVPCNNYGQPAGTLPTLADIQGSSFANELVASCTTNQQTNTAPDFSANFTAEYRASLGEFEGFVRGLYNYFDKTANSPTNLVDSVDAYGIFNLYAGLQDPSNNWSAMLYVKNITDTEKVVNREATLATKTIIHDQLGGTIAGSTTATSEYRTVELTPPREIGFTFRLNF